MKNYYDKTWKIGELARVFKVNVQLLRHYDKEGLLVPEIRNPENKWRTYRYDQIYSLGMIRLLRQLDCSLDEIKDFMVGRNAARTEEYLAQKMSETREKYEKLLRLESVIGDRFEMIRRDMQNAESDQVYVCSEGEIHYLETAGLEGDLADELFYMYPTVVLYNGDGEENRKFAIMIPPGDAGEFADRVQTIPPQDYLVGFHYGSYESLQDTFAGIRKKSEMVLDEDSYVGNEIIDINIVDQLIEEDRDRFITKVMMKIYHREVEGIDNQ